MKKLKELLQDMPVVSAIDENPDIAGLQYDSRKVRPGDLFFAIRGFESDGHHYLARAAEKGAVAAVVLEPVARVSLPQIVVPDTREAMARAAYRMYQQSLDQLTLIGVTGTNGKTSVSFLIRAILEEQGHSCGLAGTIAYYVGKERIDAWNTTPEAIDLYAMMHRMHQAGNRAVVLEVSSHAMALKRLAGLRFDVTVFTNLSRDHLDFHPDMEDYFAQKSRLFEQRAADGVAVINTDDPYGARLAKQTAPPLLTFGRSDRTDVRILKENMNRDGMTITLSHEAREWTIRTALVGRFNVENIAAAVSVARALHIPIPVITRAMERFKSVPGRLERHPLKNGALALIDYAHTPDALEKALNTAREITTNRLAVVFGCGGDRDRGKRPQMARVAEKSADLVWVTDDNPRTENPRHIIKDIMNGFENPSAVQVIMDRKQAIRSAVRAMTSGDVLLIAGKGHENYQIIGREKRPFNEAAIIREADRDA
ncbi:MAG: UDP-N-acetylmuramoyl-L-alanyl-D-glutamate--2,6-diaminopimelate ligase [Calditrichaeota bacterium]|nr:MAG: UDP-N-acetylmuramoyl-L-alanyl-D-glutamate--2,6-diaminopimelate ligase [Calditrichota bacterium]